ncbi:MAG: type II secretion system protein GspD [Deltaproteobacteria bacterium GWA2_38_16]|nr:MAG: type II secretion system protein GspD [Deltaproteobacteria bacterium GWA2_38_16]OGQ03901.1 MAG: type II secretion system protein GspD [Deltaproteobacteria bacterium RIFCSPHIGHO2_02_FULL_38_15]OGQ59946.1 MAG: type II secretion system protein GspD [Deltaproteobacteria bacterium RIFCSPLOWO2_12_FULL_38_8]HBQ20948.1 type II secretion system protein GspD [Deltaproteobacteria bacterium]
MKKNKAGLLLLFLILGFSLMVQAQMPPEPEDEEEDEAPIFNNPPTTIPAIPPAPGVVSKDAPPPREIKIEEKGPETKNAVKITSINFRDETLDAVTKSISKLTGKSFIVTEDLSRKKITIISQEDVTIEEAYRAFLSALEMNDLTLVPVGKFFKIVRAQDATKMSLKTYAGKYSPTSDGYITRIYHLKYINASAISRSLQPIVNPRALVAYEPTNSLIITDTGSNINRLLEILEHLDVKGFEEQLAVIKIKYASAKDVADQLNNFYRDDMKQGGGSRFAPPTFGGSAGGGDSGASGGESISKIIPDPRTNSIIVKANEQGIIKIKELISKLDTNVGGGGKIHVYYLQNSDAEKMAQILSQLVGGKSGGSPRMGMPGMPSMGPVDFEGEIKITGDKETNSLVITASLQDYNTLKGVIGKLDIPRKQVYVEAYILEVNVNKNKALGISYTAGVPAPGFKNGLVGGFAGTSPNSMEVILDPTKLMSPGSGVIGFVTQGSTQITLPNGEKKSIPNATALIRALASDANSNLLSAPQILALDNVESVFEASEKIPTSSGTSTSSNGVIQQNITREPIGLMLKIKPQINETSELVRLEIDQSIEDISNRKPPSDIAGQTFASTKRAMKTTVLIKDQDTVVIGGLLRDNINETSSKIPLLGDIPILGWLFKSASKETVKTNLLLLLTPTILKKYGDFRKLFDKKLRERQEFMDKNYPGDDRKTTYLDQLNPPKQE